jgi:hypothetical protein
MPLVQNPYDIGEFYPSLGVIKNNESTWGGPVQYSALFAPVSGGFDINSFIPKVAQDVFKTIALGPSRFEKAGKAFVGGSSRAEVCNGGELRQSRARAMKSIVPPPLGPGGVRRYPPNPNAPNSRRGQDLGPSDRPRFKFRG